MSFHPLERSRSSTGIETQGLSGACFARSSMTVRMLRSPCLTPGMGIWLVMLWLDRRSSTLDLVGGLVGRARLSKHQELDVPELGDLRIDFKQPWIKVRYLFLQIPFDYIELRIPLRRHHPYIRPNTNVLIFLRQFPAMFHVLMIGLHSDSRLRPSRKYICDGFLAAMFYRGLRVSP